MKIKSEVCAYVKTTPYTCDFVLRNQQNPYEAKLQTKAGWTAHLNKKIKLKKFDPETGEIYQSPENLLRALRRARTKVVDYAMCNDFEYFGTITIADDKFDTARPDLVLEALQAKLHSYQITHADFKYLFTAEYGENTKRLHFHFLASGIETFTNEHGYLDCHLFRDSFGFCNIQKIGDTEADKLQSSLYCSKYISKQSIRIGHRYFYSSKGLKKPDRFFLSGTLALAAYDELRKINAKEFAELRYAHCLGCSAAQWRTILERVELYREMRDARRKFFMKWTTKKYKELRWAWLPTLKGPYELTADEHAIFNTADVQLSMLC